MGVEYDFLTWTSFPSSLKIVHEGRKYTPEGMPIYVWHTVADEIPITPGKKLTVEVAAKQSNRGAGHVGVRVDAWDGVSWPEGIKAVKRIEFPLTTFNWTIYKEELMVPIDARVLRIRLFAHGDVGVTTWYDDLKIYQDDKLIYDNYFTALRPGKIIPTVWTPPERIIGAWQRFKTGEPMALFKPPRLLARI